MSAPRDVVIVGASLAGLRAAEALREGGYAGRLTLVGDEPHAPYDRPPLSKQVLSGWVRPQETFLPRLQPLAAAWRAKSESASVPASPTPGLNARSCWRLDTIGAIGGALASGRSINGRPAAARDGETTGDEASSWPDRSAKTTPPTIAMAPSTAPMASEPDREPPGVGGG